MEFYDVEREAYGELYEKDSVNLPMPSALIENPLYKDLTALDHIIYTLYMPLDYLAYKEQQINNQKKVWFVCSDEKMAEIANCKPSEVSETRAHLEKYSLINFKETENGLIIFLNYPNLMS